MQICFSDEDGKFKQSYASEKLEVRQSIISEISRFNREPTKEMIRDLILVCNYLDAKWLLTGYINEVFAGYIGFCFKISKKDLYGFSKISGLPSLLISSIINKTTSATIEIINQIELATGIKYHYYVECRYNENGEIIGIDKESDKFKKLEEISNLLKEAGQKLTELK